MRMARFAALQQTEAMTDAHPPRVYFTVVDAAGLPAAAMEYWAASPEEDMPTYEVLPIRRFIKLTGLGESLVEISDGVYQARPSQRIFYRLPATSGT